MVSIAVSKTVDHGSIPCAPARLAQWSYFFMEIFGTEKISHKEREILALLLFYFVTAKVFLGFSENDVLAKNWIVFLQAKLVWGVHSVLLGIVCTDTRFL